MVDRNALPIFLVGRNTLRSEHSVKAVSVLDIAHVAFGIVDACLLGIVAPVTEICPSCQLSTVSLRTAYR